MTIDVAGFEQTAPPPVVPLAVAKSPAVVAIGVVAPVSVPAAAPPPTPVAVDRQLPIGVISDAAGLAIEREARIAGDDRLQAEIDALDADVASVRDPAGAGAILVATAMAQAEARIAEVEAFIDTSVAAARANAAELFASADALFIATQGRLSAQAQTAGADQLIAAVQVGMSARDLARKTAFAAAIAATAYAAGMDNERAWASSHQVLAATMAGNAAVAETRYAVQATLNDSIAARLDSLDVAGATAAAGLADEAAARQSGDLSIAASRSTAYAASSAEADRAAAQSLIAAINAGVAGRAQARAAAYALAVAQQATITQTTAEQALANYTQVVGARFGDVYASVQTQATAIAGINGQLAASYSIKVDANGNWAGLQIINGGGTTNAIKLRADLLTLTLPGYSEQPVMSVANINGVPTLAFNGAIIADASLSAQQIAANSISQNAFQSVTNTAASSASATIASLVLKAGDRVLLLGSYAGGDAFTAGTFNGKAQMYVGATKIDELPLFLGASMDTGATNPVMPATMMTPYTVPADGNYSFVFYVNIGAGGNVNKRCSLMLISLRR